MRNTVSVVGLLVVALTLSSCRSIGAAYDESRTTAKVASGLEDGAIAVLGPPEEAQFPGLAEVFAGAVREALAERDTRRSLLDANEFYARLQRRKGYYENFGGWLARFNQTSGFLETRNLPLYGRATGVRYLLVFRDADVKREKMDVRAAISEVSRVRGCRMGCVGNAKNIFRHQLVVLGELIDLKQAKTAWKGVGESNIITSRMSKLDFGLVQYNLQQPDLGSHADQLVALVANGIADELEGIQTAAVR